MATRRFAQKLCGVLRGLPVRATGPLALLDKAFVCKSYAGQIKVLACLCGPEVTIVCRRSITQPVSLGIFVTAFGVGLEVGTKWVLVAA